MKQHISSLALSILAVLAPIQGMVLTTLTLIIIDLITGVLAAKKLKKPVTSKGIRRTIIKFIIYEVAIIAAFLTQQYLTGGTVPVCNIVTGFVGLTELTSVLENLNLLGDNKVLQTIVNKLETVNDKGKNK